MCVSRVLRRSSAMAAIIAAGFAVTAQAAESNTPAAVHIAQDLGRADGASTINITVHLKLGDRAAFDQAVDALYEPASPTYRKWMTNTDLKKFAPSELQRETVRQELTKHGLTIVSTDAFGFSVRARGTLADVERAFNTEIHQFQFQGRTFRTNVQDARLSGDAAEYVASVAGIESHHVRSHVVRAVNPRTGQPPPSVRVPADASVFPTGGTTQCLSAPASVTLLGSTPYPKGIFSGTVFNQDSNLMCDYLPNELWLLLGLDEIFAYGYNGAGQTIVIVDAFGYPTAEQDANAFSKMAGLPPLNSSNFRIVYPQGKPVDPDAGILLGWNGEIALDLDAAHTVAPGAHIVLVAASGEDDEDLQDAIRYATEHDLGNTVSNSYGFDADFLAGRDEQNSWEDVLEVAAAKGISVNFASGDYGDNETGTPVGAPNVPGDAPHATSVGGVSILNDLYNPGSTITTAWGSTLIMLESEGVVQNPPAPFFGFGFYGGGGGGESIFWPKPSWQHALPGRGRQTPDVSALADPFTGFPIVITVGSTQVVQYGNGGTSLACPIFSGFWAIANEKAGHPLGQAGRLIAALPYGGVQDVLPTTDSTPHNVTGEIVTHGATTKYSAAGIFGSALLEGNTGFTSAIFSDPLTGDVFDLSFGLDSSLIVKHGWDNATGWGTPHGMKFIDAVTAK